MELVKYYWRFYCEENLWLYWSCHAFKLQLRSGKIWCNWERIA